MMLLGILVASSDKLRRVPTIEETGTTGCQHLPVPHNRVATLLQGKCLYYREWNRPQNTLENAADDGEEQRLMFGMLYSLKVVINYMTAAIVGAYSEGVSLRTHQKSRWEDVRGADYVGEHLVEMVWRTTLPAFIHALLVCYAQLGR